MAKSKKQLELEQQVGELTADLQRIQADFVNYKRRAEEDQARAVSIGREGAVSALLPTIDNIERAMVHAPEELKEHAYIKALASAAKKLHKDLQQMGVQKIDTVGQLFNPDTMEAVAVDESAEGDHEYVVEELQGGYMMGDSVLRHAMVKVARMEK